MTTGTGHVPKVHEAHIRLQRSQQIGDADAVAPAVDLGDLVARHHQCRQRAVRIAEQQRGERGRAVIANLMRAHAATAEGSDAREVIMKRSE